MASGYLIFAGSLAVAAASLSAPALAQQVDEEPTLTAADLGLTEDQLESLIDGRATTGGAPGISFGSPVGFGASWGVIGAGIGGSTRDEGSQGRELDGSAGVVIGLGDAQNLVGAEVTYNIISLEDQFAEDGSFALKLHRNIGNGAFAVGVENLGGYGAAKGADEAYFAAYSHVLTFPNDMPIVLSGGIGNESFSNSTDRDGVGAFGSAALLLNSRISAIADYRGRGLSTAVSFTPFARLPLTATAGFINVYNEDDVNPEFSAGIGYSYSFK